jgi:dienelactone hydrolase
MKAQGDATGRAPLLVRVGLWLVVCGCVGVGLPALLLLAVAQALSSRFLGLAVLVALSTIAWWAVAARLAWRRPSLVILGLALMLTLGLGAASKICSPSGQVSANSRLTSIYRKDARFNRFSPAWLVEEADQIRLGGMLLPLLDPFMSREQGKLFSRTFNAAYSELGRSPDFVQVGSAMGDAYADILVHTPPLGHAYVYHPTIAGSARYPVVVFLHGWLGNMKAYMWRWSRFADQHGFVVICPTFGNGLWLGRNADETLQWIQTVIRADSSCDTNRVFVVGLSNGGTGVARWATSLRNTYRGLVFVSPILDGTDSPDFASAAGDRPILVVHGGKDNRVPPAHVDPCVAIMREAGLHVRSICYADADHDLILSAADQFQSDLFEWLNKEAGEPAPPPSSAPATKGSEE